MSEKQKRGFGHPSLTPEQRREIARKGGASVPGHKRAFATHPGLAASAGKKGGECSVRPKRSPAP